MGKFTYFKEKTRFEKIFKRKFRAPHKGSTQLFLHNHVLQVSNYLKIWLHLGLDRFFLNHSPTGGAPLASNEPAIGCMTKILNMTTLDQLGGQKRLGRSKFGISKVHSDSVGKIESEIILPQSTTSLLFCACRTLP